MSIIKVDCPFCLFSSGLTPYMGKGQKCEDCNGTGWITSGKYKTAKKIYGDLIK